MWDAFEVPVATAGVEAEIAEGGQFPLGVEISFDLLSELFTVKYWKLH